MSAPLLYGHRGASAHALENTLGAFARARADGADGVELDVRLSADGELAVFHDDDLQRIAGRPGRVADMPWRELAAVALPGGERIPRLDEVLAGTAPMLVNVEIKRPGARHLRQVVRGVAASAARTGAAARVLVSSFDPAAVALTRASTRLRCGLLFHAGQGRPLREAWLARLLRPHALHPERVLVDAARVASWRARGYAINVWTADEPDELRRLAGLGVDAIITNDPGAARAVLGRAQ
ncbi:MAG TPA: glycerophosphodiester phosphodiesterase [Kofleriaceae bacterium]|nr:glycerophosphodiester phosphodiesterase [Kofleriaceae bacterium]